MEKLFIIDSHSLIYKAYYAIQNLTDSKGNSTNAVYGFIKMLLKIIEIYNPDYLVSVFDASKKTFRNELYADYKATRQATPPDLIQQFSVIKQIIEKINVPVIQLANYEADDIIGTFAKKFSSQYSVYIISGDKDLTQIVDENITILNTKKGISEIDLIDKNAAEKKYEIKLRQFTDYLGLIGDSSDNVPGVKGIGPKTAIKLLNQFDSIESIYKNISLVSPESLKSKLIENKEMAFLSKTLVTININSPVELHLTRFNKQNIVNLKETFENLEFYSLIKELNLTVGSGKQFNSCESNQPEQSPILQITELESENTLEKELSGK